MSDKPRVIFATDGIFPHAVGGIQRHSRLLIETLAARGDTELTVIHPHLGVQVFDPKLGIEEVLVDPLPQMRNYLLELYEYSKQVHKVAMAHPAHLIYAQGLTVWYKLRDYAHRLIVNPHGLEPYQPLSRADYLKGMPYRVIFDRIFRRARYVVSLGGSLSDILANRVGTKKDSLQVLPNAVRPAEDWKNANPKWEEIPPLRCLFVGRWAFNKGIDTLLEAIDLIGKEGRAEEFHFSLAGKGPLWEKFTSKPIPADVLGFVDDEQLNQLYKESHVFVLPTRFEGMPTVVLEAMTFGAAIVVTDVGATRELVDETNGFIIPKNDAHALKEALYELRSADREKWQDMFQASQRKVEEKFTWGAVAGRHYELFESLWRELNSG